MGERWVDLEVKRKMGKRRRTLRQTESNIE